MTVKGRCRYLSKLVFSLTFLLLAACGGGDSDSDPGPKPDVTVPNVVATTVVPSLVGIDKASARNRLFANNLNFNFITVANSSVASGIVISHEPVANTRVANGSVINLLVSLGSSVSTDTTVLFGTITHDVSRRILLDSTSENLIILGHTSGNLNGETNSGLKDIFVSMYDVALNHKWTTLLGTGADDIGYGLAIAPSGNIYITGSTTGNLGGKMNSGLDDAFVAKLDNSGNISWVQLLGAVGADVSEGIALDSNENIYISGSTFGNLGGQTNVGNNDIFLTKFSSAGVALWTRMVGGKFSDNIRDVSVDAKDNIYICGWISATDIDGNLTSGGADIFLAKYDVDGIRVWSRLLGSASNDFCHEVTVDDLGNVYVTADTSGDLAKNTNQGDRDIVLAKYDSNGNQAWVKLLGSSMEERGRAIGIAPDNSIFVSGNTFGNLSGKTNKGMDDVFLANFDANGNLLKTTLFGTSAADQGNAIVIDSNGTKYITGKSRGDLGAGIATGGNDIFIRKSP